MFWKHLVHTAVNLDLNYTVIFEHHSLLAMTVSLAKMSTSYVLLFSLTSVQKYLCFHHGQFHYCPCMETLVCLPVPQFSHCLHQPCNIEEFYLFCYKRKCLVRYIVKILYIQMITLTIFLVCACRSHYINAYDILRRVKQHHSLYCNIHRILYLGLFWETLQIHPN